MFVNLKSMYYLYYFKSQHLARVSPINSRNSKWVFNSITLIILDSHINNRSNSYVVCIVNGIYGILESFISFNKSVGSETKFVIKFIQLIIECLVSKQKDDPQ